MKTLTWETAKNEGARETIERIERFMNEDGTVSFIQLEEYIEHLKKQYKYERNRVGTSLSAFCQAKKEKETTNDSTIV